MRLPLLNGARSFTLGGHPVVSRRLGTMPFDDAGSLLAFHYPMSCHHFLADHAVVFRVLPLTPTTTMVTTKWLVHRDARKGIDYDIERLTKVWLATKDEDRRIVEENQLGILLPAYEPRSVLARARARGRGAHGAQRRYQRRRGRAGYILALLLAAARQGWRLREEGVRPRRDTGVSAGEAIPRPTRRPLAHGSPDRTSWSDRRTDSCCPRAVVPSSRQVRISRTVLPAQASVAPLVGLARNDR